MIDFIKIHVEKPKKIGGPSIAYPKFLLKKSSDLMIQGGDFYAIWIEEKGLWSKDEQDAIESNRLFGMNIKIDLEEIIPDKAESIIEPSEVDVQPLIETKTAFDHVITTKDAIALLTASPFNLKVLQCNSKPKIQNRIKELGISFPNISYDL